MTGDFHLDGVDGHFHGEVTRRWWAQGAIHGGYVLALAMTALQHEYTDTGMALQQTALHYLRPVAEGPVHVQITPEKRGRRLCTASIKMWSAGQLAGIGMGSVAQRRAVGEVDLMLAPAVEPYDASADAGVPMTLTPIHERVVLAPRINTTSENGRVSRVGGWVTLRDGQSIDHRWIAVLVDLWAPAVYQAWNPRKVVTTADLTYHARQELPSDVQPPGAPVLVVLTNRVSAGGFVDEDVEVWSAGGVLLAQSRQMRFVHDNP